MMPGETVASGAQDTCFECGKQLEPEVCQSAAGYYVGYMANCCYGPHSRETGYFDTYEEAEKVLEGIKRGETEWLR
jgi:hypothetical protein